MHCQRQSWTLSNRRVLRATGVTNHCALPLHTTDAADRNKPERIQVCNLNVYDLKSGKQVITERPSPWGRDG
jgi:hypothetical protein